MIVQRPADQLQPELGLGRELDVPRDAGLLAPLMAPASSGQNGWRKCTKCAGLYYARFGIGAHGPIHMFDGSDDYSLLLGDAAARGQPGWRWCSQCYALAFQEAGKPAGACLAGGRHDHSSSGNYTLPRDRAARAGTDRAVLPDVTAPRRTSRAVSPASARRRRGASAVCRSRGAGLAGAATAL